MKNVKENTSPASQPSPDIERAKSLYDCWRTARSDRSTIPPWDQATYAQRAIWLERSSQPSPAPEIEKLARAVVATYDDPHLSPVAVERAIGMLRDALEQPSPARSDKDAERALFDEARKFDLTWRADAPPDAIAWRAWQVRAEIAAKAQESAPAWWGNHHDLQPLLADLATYPSPHGTLVRLADVKCRVWQAESAPSSKVAERYSTRIGEDGEYRLFRGHTFVGEIKFYADADRIVRALAAQESGESIDTPEFWSVLTNWVDARGTLNDTAARAALINFLTARRATAAPDGDALYAAWHKVGADVAGLSFADFIAALDARGATAGTTAAPVGCFKCPRDPNKRCDYCGYDLANPAATAAPGDLPPLPQPMRKVYERPHGAQELLYFTADQMREYGTAYYNAGWASQLPRIRHLEHEREYGRACIASNAGAAKDKN